MMLKFKQNFFSLKSLKISFAKNLRRNNCKFNANTPIVLIAKKINCLQQDFIKMALLQKNLPFPIFHQKNSIKNNKKSPVLIYDNYQFKGVMWKT